VLWRRPRRPTAAEFFELAPADQLYARTIAKLQGEGHPLNRELRRFAKRQAKRTVKQAGNGKRS